MNVKYALHIFIITLLRRMSSRLYIFTKKLCITKSRFLCAHAAHAWAPLCKVRLLLCRKSRTAIFPAIKKSAGGFSLVCRFSFYMLTPRFSRCLRSLRAARNKRSVIYLCALRRRRGLRHRRRVRCRRACLPVCCLMTVCLPDGCLSKTC